MHACIRNIQDDGRDFAAVLRDKPEDAQATVILRLQISTRPRPRSHLLRPGRTRPDGRSWPTPGPSAHTRRPHAPLWANPLVSSPLVRLVGCGFACAAQKAFEEHICASRHTHTHACNAFEGPPASFEATRGATRYNPRPRRPVLPNPDRERRSGTPLSPRKALPCARSTTQDVKWSNTQSCRTARPRRSCHTVQAGSALPKSHHHPSVPACCGSTSPASRCELSWALFGLRQCAIGRVEPRSHFGRLRPPPNNVPSELSCMSLASNQRRPCLPVGLSSPSHGLRRARSLLCPVMIIDLVARLRSSSFSVGVQIVRRSIMASRCASSLASRSSHTPNAPRWLIPDGCT